MSERWRIPNSKPWITDADRAEVDDALWEIPQGDPCGYQVRQFERELAEFLGRKYVVCVSSGTVALELALRAQGAPKYRHEGWAVNAFGFIATANAAERAHGRVGFIDGSLNVLGEVPANPSDLSVVDACQAFGAKLPPSLADCYSFNWNKPITTLGGGCVATDDAELAGTVRDLANQGRPTYPPLSVPYTYAPGTNARMSDMQAALGRSQLRRVGEILGRRKNVAEVYYEAILSHPDYPVRPAAPRDSWFLYPIELSNRDEVHAKMLERGIQTRSCADWLLPAHPYYAEKYGYKKGDFPEAERRADRTLLLPLYPEMTLEDVQTVCAALEECDARD